MGLSYDDVLEILKIIDASDYHEVQLEIGDFKLVVRKRGAAGPAPARAAEEARDRPGSLPGPEAPGAPADRGTEPSPAQAGPAPRAPRPLDPALVARDGLHAVTAPMAGTFYRAPAPGAPAFVEVGSRVEAQETVGILEVMKLMTEIPAGCRGRVVAICAENAQPVEHGQALVLIEPDR
jgi:acetyl-CoA carboxylase biotin carboxyl carrier protein